MFIFSTTFVRNISYSKKNWKRYDDKCDFIFTSRLTKYVRQQKFKRRAGMWSDQSSTSDHVR
jgi:hypothetical protein